MKEWEFLLQKEGDRSWLPLDSPAVEILEGRYRIVARSRWANAEVQIRISHLVTDEDPPKRRIQKRSNRTNKDGLMVVIPFTQLEAGVWELHCASTDLMSELVGDAWQFAVKLQILPHDTEGEVWEPDWTPSAEVQSEATALKDDGILPMPPAIPAPDSAVTESGAAAGIMDTPEAAEPTVEPEPLTAPSEPSTEQPAELPPEVAALLGASMDRLFQIAEQLSAQLVDDVMRDFDLETELTSEVTVVDAPAPPVPLPDLTPLLDATGQPPSGYSLNANEIFVLQLDCEAFVASHGEPLTVSGQVQVEAQPTPADGESGADQPVSHASVETADPWGVENQSFDLTGATAQEVQLYLRDPQTLQILVSDRHPLSHQTPPFPFSFSLSLPEHLNTHLLLGEIALCGRMPDHGETLTTLITQSFTITANPTALVGELEKLSEVLDETLASSADEQQIDLPVELSNRLAKEQAAPSLNLSFLEPEPTEEPPPVEPPKRFSSLAGQPLPPQIYRPDPNQPRIKIELPGFVLLDAEPDTSATDEPDLAANAPGVAADDGQAQETEATAPDTPAPPTTEDAVAPVMATDLAEAHTDESATTPTEANDDRSEPVAAPNAAIAEDAVESESQMPSIDLPSPIQMGFQALRLQDRFLRRLNSLATDAELSNWLRNNLYPERTATSYHPPTPPKAENGRVTEEFVVDDEPASSPSRVRNGSKPGKENTPLPTDVPSVLILPEDEPIPTPELEVATGELVAGQPVNIRIKLPDLTSRIYVKLWVTDWQTRSLLDGPRWLLDFLPNGKGQLEAFTQLTVPFGSLEVRFEAIAIEMHTQRESHKVGVERNVVPPDLPVVSLEGFE